MYPDRPSTKEIPKPTDDELQSFTHQLLSSKTFPPRRYLVVERRIPARVLRHYRIGWDGKRNAYTIPILDEEDRVECVKWIKPAWASKDGQKHPWICNSHEVRWPMLFPTYDFTGHDTILVCEGEWDVLSLISLDLFAVTATGGGGQWSPEFNPLFADKHVYLLPDSDEVGQEHAALVARQLWDYAASVRRIRWKDLT